MKKKLLSVILIILVLAFGTQVEAYAAEFGDVYRDKPYFILHGY